MKFVISAAFQPPEHLVPIAQAADEAGYEAIASSDHAVYPETLDTPYPYTEDGTRRYDESSHFPDPWVLAGASAGNSSDDGAASRRVTRRTGVTRACAATSKVVGASRRIVGATATTGPRR